MLKGDGILKHRGDLKLSGPKRHQIPVFTGLVVRIENKDLAWSLLQAAFGRQRSALNKAMRRRPCLVVNDARIEGPVASSGPIRRCSGTCETPMTSEEKTCSMT